MSDSNESGVTYTEAPPSPDYIPGLKEPEQALPLPDYVPGPEHVDDEIVAEDASPTAQLPEYVPESDLEAYLEEDDDEDPKEDLVDYPIDGGDDGDDKEGSSEDDEDDDIYIKADEKEKEEHPASPNSVLVALPAADQASSAEETDPFKTNESVATSPPYLAYRMTARISILAPVHVPAWSDSEHHLLSLFVLGPGYEVGESSSAVAARRAGGLRADYNFVATMDREIRHDPEREVGYGITDSWDEIVETLQGAPVSTDTELGGYMREFETRFRRDTDEIYSRLDDEQSERQLLAGRLNLLFRDRRAHAYTRHLMETKASLSREAWVRSMDVSYLTRGITAALAALNALRSTNGDDSHNSGTGVKRTKRATRECTYIDFLKCQPLHFKGTKGVASLSQWLERMESVFHISNYAVENQVKFSTCTLHSVALTWWNTHVKIVGHDSAYDMPWKTLMKMTTDKYCPQKEIKKLEMEIWDLKVTGTDLTSSTQCFQELALLCGRMFPEESDKIERYIGASGEKKQYGGPKPLCAKCNYHHDGQCTPKCHKCNKVGHFARDCRSTTNTNNDNNQRGTGSGQKPTCYECGVQGHFKRECPKVKNNNNNHGNQGGRDNAPAKVYAVGRAGTEPDSSVVTGKMLPVSILGCVLCQDTIAFCLEGVENSKIRIFLRLLSLRVISKSDKWLHISSGSGNNLHWQWELILPVGTLT
nr:hypothetical protein [Tanacetum cinerariifolium]